MDLSKNQIAVIDIDNTIANTWNSLYPKTISQSSRSEIKKIKKKDYSSELLKKVFDDYDLVFFLSARNFKLYHVTADWIQKNFNVKKFKLRLVPDVELKLIYLKKFTLNNKTILYVDDLSYNHENGEVKFYKKVIKRVRKNSNILYYGYDDIQKGLNSIIENYEINK